MSEKMSGRARSMISALLILLLAVPAFWASASEKVGEPGAAPRVTDDAQSLVVGSGETYELFGCHTYTKSVQIDGILKVKPYDGSDDTTGNLTLVAPVISVGSGGSIVADGRGFGGGGGATEWGSGVSTAPGGKGGAGGKGGDGAPACGVWGAGGGGGSNGGQGGAGNTYGLPGKAGTETAGGDGGTTTINSGWGGKGGSGFGGGGGGGAGDDWHGGGGGGGGSGGSGGLSVNNGAKGAGPWGGDGGIGYNAQTQPFKGADGGYMGKGVNGDTTADMSVLRGSGGGGGGACTAEYGGAGGGGAGGGSVSLVSAGDIFVNGSISTTGGGGGKGGRDYIGMGGDGGGGAGGGILLYGLGVSASGSIDARGRGGDSLNTANGGTIKIFFDVDSTASANIQAGRIFKNGRPKMQGLIAPANDGTGTVRTDFSWKAALDPESDPVTYHIQVSDSAIFSTTIINKQGLTQTQYTSEQDLTGASFYWRVRARDAMGYGSWSATWKFLTDITPPQSRVNPLGIYTNSTNITVSWTGTDDSSGISFYDIFVAEGTGAADFIPWLEKTCKTTAVFQGKDGVKYNFYSVATDRGRNREADPGQPDAFTTVDVTPPVTTMTALLPFQGSLRFQLSWTGKDATSGIQYYNIYGAEGDADFSLLQEHTTKNPLQFDAQDGQDYKFYIVGCDNAGNWEAMPSATKMLKTRVDLTPPEVALRFGTPNFGLDPVFVTAATPVYLDSTDNFAGVNGTFYNIDGRGAKPYANSIKETAPGPHNMTYWATDKAGNRGEDGTLWFFVDSETPVTVLSCAGLNFITGDRVFVIPSTSIVLTASDVGSGVNYIEYNLDKRSYARYLAPLKFTTGTHSLVFRAQDKVGNIEAEQTLTIMVDAITPTTRTDGDFSALSKNDVVIGLVASDAESGVAQTFYRVLREKEKTGDFQVGNSVTVEASSGDGNYTLQYYSVDRVGNTEKTRELKVRIDTQVGLTLAFEGTPSVSTSKYLIEGMTETGAKMTIGIIDVLVSADGSFSQEVDLKPGKNTFVVTITDQAGNTKEQSVAITYNQPVAAADWFLPLIVIVVIAGAVGGGALVYMSGKKGGRPPPRAPPVRGPPPRTPPRPPVPPARAAQGRMPQSRSPQARILPPRAPPPVPPPTP